MTAIATGLIVISLLIWLGLLTLRGQFWRADQRLGDFSVAPAPWPSVWVVIPARNEADVLPISLQSLLTQDYPGPLSIVVVDDQSTDGTAAVARETAQQVESQHQLGRSLVVIDGQPLPDGWTGKLWAMEQGIAYAQALEPEYILLTDADIEHDLVNLRQLVVHAHHHRLEMASLMVKLRCETVWERVMIPAFVFFFQKLYPFAWVNDVNSSIAAAAGGCILIRSRALSRIGGLDSIRHTLIDDCALANAVKIGTTPCTPSKHRRIWLGLGTTTISLRPYPTLQSIWRMVARTAYTQLNYSVLLLIGTVLGMTFTYLLAPIGLAWGVFFGEWWVAVFALVTWCVMAYAYWPTLNYYQQSPALAFCLPVIALLYVLMTLDSARQHWIGKGGNWKGRTYP